MKDKTLKLEIKARFMEAAETIIKADNGVNISGFMEAIGEYQQNYAQYINGRRYPTIEGISRLCSEFGYNPNWIILGEGPRTREPSKSPLERLEEIEKEIKDLKKLIK